MRSISFISCLLLSLLIISGHCLAQVVEDDADKVVDLESVVVSAELESKNAQAETFIITEQQRKNTTNALQLLDKLNGVTVDWASENVKIGEYRDVPMLLEGREVSAEYIRNLNPRRIRKIEVLRYPKGRYGDVPIVLNIVLNNLYTGFDFGVHAKGMVSLKNKHSHSSGEGINFTYATRKWNIYGDVGFEEKNVFKATSYEQTYKDITEKTAVEDYKIPNANDKLTHLDFTAGIDYKIGSNHTISLQAWADGEKGENTEEYRDVSKKFLSLTENAYGASNLTTGIFYRGIAGNRLYLSSDVIYNYYGVDEDKQYTFLSQLSALQYRGRKDYWRANADARYVWSNKVTSTIGYTFTNKNYFNYNQDSQAQLFSSFENRHDAYFNVMVIPSNNFNFVLGSNFLYVDEHNDVVTNGNFSWMPQAKLFWQPFKRVSLSANYYCDVQHPNLDQLSTVTYQRNSYLWHTGNPGLKPRVMHYMEYRLDLKKIVEITYMYKHSSQEITPWFYSLDNNIIETLTNGEFRHQYIGLNGYYSLPHGFGFNFTANYQWYKRCLANEPWRNGHTWYLDAMLTWSDGKRFTLMSGYFLRYDKEPLLQGEQYGQNEQFMLGANALVWKNKFSIMLMATIPTNAISKRTFTNINIPQYQYITWNDDRVNSAIIQLSLRYNLATGSASRLQNTNAGEREK